jgi:excisionase family DNA binding protein
MTVLPIPGPAEERALADDRQAVLAQLIDRCLGQYATRPTVSVEELGAILRVGRTSAYQLVKEGRVVSLRVGRSIRVPVPALAALLLGVGAGG